MLNFKKIGYMAAIKTFFIGIVSLLCTACSTNLTALNYRTNIDVKHLKVSESNNDTPIVLETADFTGSYNKILSDGYILLGMSVFQGALDDKFNSIQLARDKGASLILRTTRFSHSEYRNYYIPLTSTSNTSTSLYGGINSNIYDRYNSYGGSIHSDIYGRAQSSTTNTEWVPVQSKEDIYQQAVALFVKVTDRFVFGAYYRDLDIEEQKKFSTIKGVVVTNVIRNSPAFLLNLLPGDLIIELNNQPVTGYSELGKILSYREEIKSIVVVRNGVQVLLVDERGN